MGEEGETILNGGERGKSHGHLMKSKMWSLCSQTREVSLRQRGERLNETGGEKRFKGTDRKGQKRDKSIVSSSSSTPFHESIRSHPFRQGSSYFSMAKITARKDTAGHPTSLTDI